MLSLWRTDNRSSSSHIWSSGFGLYGKAHLRLLASTSLLQVLEERHVTAVRFLIFAERGEKINTVICYLGKLRCKTDSLDLLERTGGICCDPLCCVERAGSAEARIIRENNSFIQERKSNDTYYCASLPARCFSSRRI